jgi:hypothetical protein
LSTCASLSKAVKKMKTASNRALSLPSYLYSYTIQERLA